MTVFRPPHSGRCTVQKTSAILDHMGNHVTVLTTQQQMLADQPCQLFIEQHSTHTTPFKMCSGDLGSQSGQGPSRFMRATICWNDDDNDDNDKLW